MGSALWNPFANMASLDGNAVTIVRGEGSWVFDDHGRAYLDAIASPIVRGPGEIPPA